MRKLHITQDDDGYWMLSAEHPDGTLQLLAHQFASPDHLVENARELVTDGTYPDAVLLVDPPRKGAPADLQALTQRLERPEPRKAGE